MREPSRSARYRGALLGVAIGDALGAPFEGSSGCDEPQLARLISTLLPLRYTDDTHMTLGMARSLTLCRGFDGPHMAETFARNYECEPWRGYGPGPPHVFEALRSGSEWDQAARVLFGGAGSFGNGAAMRVAPAALFGFPDLDSVEWLARETARITHAHEIGIDGAVLQACAITVVLQTSPEGPIDKDAFLPLLHRRLRTTEMRKGLDVVAELPADAPPEEVIARLGNGIEAHRSVPTALYSFLRAPDSFLEPVLFAIRLGGDSDTIASMAGALSGAYHGEHAITPRLGEHVEDAPMLRMLADALLLLAETRGTSDKRR